MEQRGKIPVKKPPHRALQKAGGKPERRERACRRTAQAQRDLLRKRRSSGMNAH